MASSLYNELRTARDQHNVAPDASDGVLLLIARAQTGDPDELAEMLRDKGITLDPASVRTLAAVVRSSSAAEAAPPASVAPAPPAAVPAGPGSAGPMSFLRRIDDQPRVVPAPAAPPRQLSTPATPETGRRRNRQGLSAAHEARLAAAASGAAPPVVQPPAPQATTPPPPVAEPQADVRSVPPGVEAPVAPPEPEPGQGYALGDFSDDVDVFATRENPITFTRREGAATVTVQWPAADAAVGQLVYLLVSSPTQVPVRPGAGTRVLATPTPVAEVPVGSGPYFSVFAYTAADPSSLPASSPVHHAAGRVVPEVASLRVSTHADAVVLSWTAPDGVDKVRVLRGKPDEALPPHYDAGLEIPSNPEFARDSDVLPGRRYEYRVVTQFVDGRTGHRALSAGVAAEAVIPATPDPVMDLAAQVTGDTAAARVELRWRTPALGRVVIYESPTPPQHAATGRVISTAQLDALPLGRQVSEPTLLDGDTSVVPSIPFRQADGARRAFTPVTLIGEQAAVGQAAVVNLLGGVFDAEVTERVDWQLLRFAWPVGASFVEVERGAIGAEPDGSAATRISRDEYRRLGGLRMNLPVNGCDLHLRGSVHFGNGWTLGPVSVLTYPGRWVLRYQFERAGLMSRRRQLQIQVDRVWPDFGVVLARNADRLPLTYLDYTEHPKQFPVQGAALRPGEWHTVSEVEGEGQGFTRLFGSQLASGWPIVIDPPMQPRPVDAAPPPLVPGELRCVTCMQPQPELPQRFRCEGTCAPTLDPVLSGFRGEAIQARPVFAQGGPALDSVACPACGVPTRTVLCKACHSTLPPRSTSTDPVSVTVVGAQGTGKTTYLVSLCDWIEKVWGPATGALAAPLDPHTTGRLKEMRESLDDDRTVGSTVAAGQNRDVLSPLVMGLDHRSGRLRSVAFYDVAGEDVEQPDTVRVYGPTMARSDAILFLLDPLQIPDVRNFLEGQVPLPPVAGNPLTVMHNIIEEIRRRTNTSGRLPMPIMVALSKLDGIHRAVRTPGTDLTDLLNGGSALMYDRTPGDSLALYPADQRQTHEEALSLLLRLKGRQFVQLVENSFPRVEYFGLSALGHAPAGGTTLSPAGVSSFRVADPLRWLVARRWPER